MVAGASSLVPGDSRGLCDGVLGRNDTLREVPAGLLAQVKRALERWACRIVERETVLYNRVFTCCAPRVLPDAGLIGARASYKTYK